LSDATECVQKSRRSSALSVRDAPPDESAGPAGATDTFSPLAAGSDMALALDATV